MHIATYYKHSQTLALLQEQGFIMIFILEKNIFWGEQEKTTKNSLSTLHRILQRTSPLQKREMEILNNFLILILKCSNFRIAISVNC